MNFNKIIFKLKWDIKYFFKTNKKEKLIKNDILWILYDGWQFETKSMQNNWTNYLTIEKDLKNGYWRSFRKRDSYDLYDIECFVFDLWKEWYVSDKWLKPDNNDTKFEYVLMTEKWRNYVKDYMNRWFWWKLIYISKEQSHLWTILISILALWISILTFFINK